MRNVTRFLLTCSVAALFTFTAHAQKYEPVYFSSDSVQTSAVASVATTSPLFGKVVGVFLEAQTNMYLTITTVTNEGLTFGNARTVVGTSLLTPSSASPTGALDAVYMYGDKLSINAGLSPTNINRSLKGKILLEIE